MIKKETKKWQERWDVDNRGRKYHSVQKSINAQCVNRRNRKEESVLTRLRFDHRIKQNIVFIRLKSIRLILAM